MSKTIFIYNTNASGLILKQNTNAIIDIPQLIKLNLPSPNRAVQIEINTMRNVSDHIVQCSNALSVE